MCATEALLPVQMSAGASLVLAAFETRLRPEQLTVEQSQPLTEDLYLRLRA